MRISMNTVRGNKSVSSILLTYKLGSFHKGKNLLPLEQILSFKKRPHFGKKFVLQVSSLANEKSRKLSPFGNMAEKKHGGVHIHLNFIGVTK